MNIPPVWPGPRLCHSHQFLFGIFGTIGPSVGKVLSEKKDARARVSLRGLLTCFNAL